MQYILDSCSVINLASKNNTKFDYGAFSKTINEENTILVTPYSFYELIAGIRNSEEMVNMMRKYSFGLGVDCFVANYNNLFPEDGSTQHQIISKFFDFKMHISTEFPYFAKRRKELKSKIYKDLYRKIEIICRLYAMTYLYLRSFLENDNLTPDYFNKIAFVNAYFTNYDNSDLFFIFNEEYIESNKKIELDSFVVTSLIKTLNVVDVVYSNVEGNDDEVLFNRNLVNNMGKTIKEYEKLPFEELEFKVYKKTKGKINRKSILQYFRSSFGDKDMFYDVLEFIISKNGFCYKKFSNDIIDACNFIVLESHDNCTYVTEDKKWSAFLISHKDRYKFCMLFNNFYEKYASEKFKKGVENYLQTLKHY